jgi:SAM-dependent methyltransferase
MKGSIRTQPVGCLLCQADDPVGLFEAKDRLHGIQGTFTYVQCRRCGLVYMNPQVVPEDLGSLYPADYEAHGAAEKAGGFAIHRVQQRLRRRPGFDRLSRGLVNVKIPWPIYRTLTSESRVLDVGCGAGSFLAQVRQDRGCQVYGVDVSGAAARRAKTLHGIEVFEGALPDAPFPESSFDVITAWWSLEHMPDPLATVSRMYRLLKDGGHCFLGLPNFCSINARWFKSRWFHLDPPRHLSIWTPRTATQMLQEYGFLVKAIYFDRTPGGLLGSLQYAVFGDNIAPAHKNLLRHSNLLWISLLPWTLLVSLLGQSDIMVVHAEKKSGPTQDSANG